MMATFWRRERVGGRKVARYDGVIHPYNTREHDVVFAFTDRESEMCEWITEHDLALSACFFVVDNRAGLQADRVRFCFRFADANAAVQFKLAWA